MPSPRRIARYWQTIGSTFDVDAEVPRCFCCGHTSSEWRHFERAHLVDRQLDGLDNEPNLVMLCPFPCHALMPMFEIGEWEKAIQWVANHGWGMGLAAILDRTG